ncbi:MAG: TetR/AcrR family transcriptional regulator [Myxococcota bacterium]
MLKSPDADRTPRAERTRARVLDAAVAAFREHGFSGATTAAIAREAEVSEGSVFSHFGSKSGLLLGVMQRYYGAAFEDLDALAASAGSPADRLRQLTRGWLVRVVEDWSLVRVFSQHGRYSDEPAIQQAYHALSRDLTRRFVGCLSELRAAGAIRDDLPMSLLRDLVFGSGEHLALRWAAEGGTHDAVQAADRIVDIVLAGAAPRVGDPPSLSSLDHKLDLLLERSGALP